MTLDPHRFFTGIVEDSKNGEESKVPHFPKQLDAEFGEPPEDRRTLRVLFGRFVMIPIENVVGDKIV